MSDSIRTRYDLYGIDSVYNGSDPYTNPHMNDILSLVKMINPTNSSILDLCCGNGEITNLLKSHNNVHGSDPYMKTIYENNTNTLCYEYSFADISKKFEHEFDYIICSYALHLCEDSYMSNVLYNLNCKYLVVISPSDVILDRVLQYLINKKFVSTFKLNRSHMFIFESVTN